MSRLPGPRILHRSHHRWRLSGVSNALFDGPLNGVYQVVMHFAAPLSVARAQKLFAVACRTTIVHLQTGIAAIRQPLRFGIITPVIACLGTAVDIEDKGQVLALGFGWQGEIAVDG